MNLQEQLNAIEERMNEIAAEIEAATEVTQIETLTQEYEGKKAERARLMAALQVTPVEVTQRSTLTINGASGGSTTPTDQRGTMEYRMAFMRYVQTGRMQPELRADETTFTSDVSALIPTTVSDRIIQKLENYGQVYQRITKSNIKGGYKVPISSLNPEAVWLGEGEVAPKGKATVNSFVDFSYYKLQVRIATSLEASVTTLDSFEALVADKILKAIIKAIEKSVFTGSGINQPTGIFVETRIPSAQKVTLTAADLASWDTFYTKFIAKLPSAYRENDNAIYVAQGTFDNYIAVWKDANGQPIVRTTNGVDGKPIYRVSGYEVIVVDIKEFETAATGDHFAAFGDLSQWDLNSNLAITYRKYFDENTDEVIDKITTIADGKTLDANAFVIAKKGA